MKSKYEENEAADAILLLSMGIFGDKDENEAHAYLKASTWEKEIFETKFEMQENTNKVVFRYDIATKRWSLRIVTGFVRIFDSQLSHGSEIAINNGAIINLGNLEFIFYYSRPKRPQKSYQKLICEAIESSVDKKMTLSQIYEYFVNEAGFSLSDSNTWKNSIRHNLSLNKIFVKIPRDKNEMQGKGAFWGVDYNMKEEGKASGLISIDNNVKLHGQQSNIILINKVPNISDHNRTNIKRISSYPRKNNGIDESESLLIYQKPSSINFLLKNIIDKNCRKRKNKEIETQNKKRKLNFLQIETSKATLETKEILEKDVLKNFSEIEMSSLFTPTPVQKDRRSQSIIELSKDFDTLSLYGIKPKDRNKKKFS